jgi:hypothetical protein
MSKIVRKRLKIEENGKKTNKKRSKWFVND